MKQTVRMTSLVLILALVFLLIAPPYHAAEWAVQTIRIVSDGNPKPQHFSVIADQQELYMKATDLERLTRFKMAETADGRLAFMLGLKRVVVDPVRGAIETDGSRFMCKQPIARQGQYWLPLSDILPWLNTRVSVSDGMLHISSDPVSIWEVQTEFGLNLTEYLFNIEEEMGGEKGSITILLSMLLMDTLLGVRLDRAIPYKGASMRDYQVYMDTFRAFATDDFLVSGCVADAVELGGGLYDIQKMAEGLGLGVDRVFTWQGSLPSAAGSLVGHAADAFDVFSDTLSTIKALDDAVKLKELAGAFSIIETALKASDDYHMSFAYIYGADTVRTTRTVAEEAARRSYHAYRDTQDAVGVAALEYVTRSLLDISADHTAGSLLGKSVSSATGYLKAIDAALDLVWPINRGAEETTNLTVYVDIQHDALDSYHRYESRSAKTPEDITAMRLSAMMFLKAGKKAVQAKQALIDPFGGKDLLDLRIASFDQMLTRFALSATAMENDATTDKTSFSEALLSLFADVERLETSPPETGRGNTRGNVVNGGMAVLDDDWVIHLGLTELHAAANPYSFAIYRTKIDNTAMLPNGFARGAIGGLNSLDGRLYFVQGHQLYVANMDGSRPVLLADDVYGDVSVVGDAIYFVQMIYDDIYDNGYGNGPVQKINLDGSARTTLTTVRADAVNVVDDLIYFLDLDKGGRLCVMSTDGSDLTTFDQVAARRMIVADGWIYFTNGNDSSRLYRVHPDSGRPEKISDDAASAFNVHAGILYYASHMDQHRLFRIAADGTGREQLSEHKAYRINIVADRIYYLSDSRIGIVTLDGHSLGEAKVNPGLLYPSLQSPGGAVIVHYDHSVNPLGIRQRITLDLRQSVLDAFQAWNSPQSLIRNRQLNRSALAIAGEVYDLSVDVIILGTDSNAYRRYLVDKIGDTILVLEHFADDAAYAILVTYQDRQGNTHNIGFTSSEQVKPGLFTQYRSETLLPLP